VIRRSLAGASCARNTSRAALLASTPTCAGATLTDPRAAEEDTLKARVWVAWLVLPRVGFAHVRSVRDGRNVGPGLFRQRWSLGRRY
jgi:hypothetical protein